MMKLTSANPRGPRLSFSVRSCQVPPRLGFAPAQQTALIPCTKDFLQRQPATGSSTYLGSIVHPAGTKQLSILILTQICQVYRMYQMPRPILIQATRNPKVQFGWPILAVFAPIISQGNSDVGKSS